MSDYPKTPTLAEIRRGSKRAKERFDSWPDWKKDISAMDTKKLAQKLVNAAEELVKEDPMVVMFDSLKSKQKVKAVFQSVMGDRKFPKEWIVGSSSTTEFNILSVVSITLIPVDDSWKPIKDNFFKIHKRTQRDGTTYVGATYGVRGLRLVSLNGVVNPR